VEGSSKEAANLVVMFRGHTQEAENGKGRNLIWLKFWKGKKYLLFISRMEGGNRVGG